MIAVVPARGGSKGLPRKNLRSLADKPLIVHTLECALAATSISRVVVTTDDRDIADIAMAVVGVQATILRPAALGSDDASVVDVYLHAAAQLSTPERPVTAICALLPTAPLRRTEDIDACVSLFRRAEAEVVLSVVGAKPAAWHQVLCGDGRLATAAGGEGSIENRQAYARTVVPNGSIYVLDVAALAASRTYFGPRTYGYEMPPSRSIDIDAEDDFLMAEALLAYEGRQ